MRCDKCNLVFPTQLALQIHNRSMCQYYVPELYECPNQDCSRTFSSANSLSKHSSRCSSKPNVSEITVPELGNNSQAVDCVEASDSANLEIEEPKLNLVNDFKDSLHMDVNEFVAKLYAKPSLPRSHVQWLIDNLKSFLDKSLDKIGNIVTQSLVDCSASEETVCDVDAMFDAFKSSFDHLSTEYKRLKFFAATGTYIPPESYEIGVIDVAAPSATGPVLKQKKVYGQKVPLEKVLKEFLELPDSYSSIMTYMKSLEGNPNIVNYAQCPHWKRKLLKYKPEDIVLPLFLFYDDFQCNNVLGSHSEKLGGVYTSLPCLPPECASAIENIFLALVFKTSYRGLFGDSKVFAPLIDMLTSLEKNGISVNTSEGVRQVYFVTSLLLGDNLGVNSLGGFVESFTANFFCRFCKLKRCVAQTQTVEDCSLFRDEITQSEDLLINNPKLTGVKSDCVLNALPSFNITTNYCVDSFHDLLEGCCHYSMMHILIHCIPKYFDIELLNNRINLYDFGPCESNRVPLLRPDFDTKEKLKMSGSETLLFVKHFGLLIGDRVLPDDPYWHLYVKLRKLLELVLSKCLGKSSREVLKTTVKEYCTLYLSVTRDTLKPKMHFLTHYSTVFAECGTFDLMSTKKYERKHRALLVPAHATMSRTCITKTVAIKHQLDFSFRLMSRQSILPSIVKGPSMLLCLSELDYFNALLTSLPKSIVSQSSSCLSHNWVLFKGTKYKPGMVLLLDVKDCGPVFGVLRFVLSSESDLSFVFSYMVTFGYDEHVVAYEVDHTNVYSSVSPDDLYDPLPLFIHNSISGEKYVILRYSL